MATQAFILGKDAKLYYGAEEAALGAMNVIGNVRDVKVSLSADEADVTTRENGGWKGTAATLRECTIEFDMLWKPADPAFAAIRTAFLTSGLVELAALDQDRSVSGAQRPKGSFSITSFNRDESLTEGIKTNVTAKLSVFDEWVEV